LFLHTAGSQYYPLGAIRGGEWARSRQGAGARMASWKEIDRIRKEPKGFRALAKGLRAQFSDDLTDWEKDFLEGIAGRDGKEEFTTRQSEKLLQIRDDYTSVSELPGGFSVKIVLKECKGARLNLSEGDEQWVLQSYERSPTTIRRKNAGRLMRCARELHIIEQEYVD
jgi:hypothetical protein